MASPRRISASVEAMIAGLQTSAPPIAEAVTESVAESRELTLELMVISARIQALVDKELNDE